MNIQHLFKRLIAVLLALTCFYPSGRVWAGDSCPSECVCVRTLTDLVGDLVEAKQGRTADDLKARIGKAQPGEPIIVQDIRHVRMARALKPKNLILLERSASPQVNVTKLKEKPAMVTVFHNVPDTIEQAEVIHRGRRGLITKAHVEAIKSTLGELKAASTQVATLGGSRSGNRY